MTPSEHSHAEDPTRQFPRGKIPSRRTQAKTPKRTISNENYRDQLSKEGHCVKNPKRHLYYREHGFCIMGRIWYREEHQMDFREHPLHYRIFYYGAHDLHYGNELSYYRDEIGFLGNVSHKRCNVCTRENEFCWIRHEPLSLQVSSRRS